VIDGAADLEGSKRRARWRLNRPPPAHGVRPPCGARRIDFGQRRLKRHNIDPHGGGELSGRVGAFRGVERHQLGGLGDIGAALLDGRVEHDPGAATRLGQDGMHHAGNIFSLVEEPLTPEIDQKPALDDHAGGHAETLGIREHPIALIGAQIRHRGAQTLPKGDGVAM